MEESKGSSTKLSGGFVTLSGEEKRNFIQSFIRGRNGRTKNEVENDMVLQGVETAFENEQSNPYFAMMLDAMANVGCPVDMNSNVVVKICDEDMEGMLGSFNREKHQLEICQQAFNNYHFKSKTRAIQTTLSHLLVEAFDDCRANFDSSKPEHDMCSAIRASALSGVCSSDIQLLNKVQVASRKRGYQTCVLRNAVRSFLARHPTWNVEDTQPLVRKVFPTCFHDHSPHDRLPYDEKQAQLSYKAYTTRNRYLV